MLLQQGQNGGPAPRPALDALQALQQTLKPGWTVHLTHDNRFYYCNHITQTASWLPPVESWVSNFPYGWEEALDHDGKPYYVNHLNRTTTYEDPRKDWSEEPPQPRDVTLSRHPELGFGFVAGSEKPVIVRFVTDGGPSVDLLQPGDQILAINGEDVKKVPRDYVIKLVRACKEVVHLTVCQPPLDNSARKSALLSAAKKAKLKSNPSRVRFAEGVVVNGAPLFPPSTFSNGETSIPVLPNVLKVYLENGQTKSFKYDSSTTVRDVVSSLLQKLCIRAAEHFSLVVEHFKSLRRNKLTLLDPNESVSRIAARPGSHNLRCLFRVAFVPKEAAELAQRDLAAFEYLYLQCCNDVVQERYAPELKYDVSLRLAALHIHQHALAHNLAGKLSVKAVEREFGLERFVPVSLMGSMKRKELRKLLAHFLKLNQNFLPGQKSLTSFQAKLHYLNIVSELPSYGAKCFSTNLRDASMETVLLVSPKFGISQILGIRNSVPVALADIEDMQGLVVRREDEISRMVAIYLQNRELTFSLEDRDAEELVLVLQGYFHLLTGEQLPMDEERDPWPEDCAPHYLSPHAVRPTVWNYAPPCDPRPRIVNFSQPPPYHHTTQTPKDKMNGQIGCVADNSCSSPLQNGTKKSGVDGNMNIKNKQSNNYGAAAAAHMDPGFDFQSVVSMEILQDDSAYMSSKNNEVLKRVAEMQALVMTSEQYLLDQQQREQRDNTYPSPHTRHHVLSRLTEEEDSDSHLSLAEAEIPAPGQLKHSDSLLLLTQGPTSEGLDEVVRNLDLQDVEPSESDTDSNSTPASSPCHRAPRDSSRLSTQSFGLHSPDGLDPDSTDIQEYLKKLQDDSCIQFEFPEGSLYLDPDIIDLTAIPPPATPDDGVNPLPMQPSLPPTPFADTVGREQTIYWGEEDQDSMTTNTSGIGSECRSDDLEAFLATVAIAAPAPATEITPEEILSYIIPPPPQVTSPVYVDRIPYNSIPKVQSAKDESPLRSCLRRSSLDGTVSQPRSNGYSPFSPKTTRRGANFCCTAPRASPDYELRPAKQTSPQVSVSDWPVRNGPLKLSLPNHGDGVMDACITTNCGTLPKPCIRASSDCSYATLPKNCTYGVDGVGMPSYVPKSCMVSVRNKSAANMSHDPPPAPPSPAKLRNGISGQRCYNGHGSAVDLGSSRREDLLAKSDAALAVMLVRLDQLAAQCDRAQSQGGGAQINEEQFQTAKDEVLNESCEMVSASKNLVKRLTSEVTDTELADACSCCLQHLRRLSECCSDMAGYTPSPLHTRNIVLRVHDVANAVRNVLRSPTSHTSEHLAGVLSSLLRSLRVFE